MNSRRLVCPLSRQVHSSTPILFCASVDDRNGSNSEVAALRRDVCFTPESGMRWLSCKDKPVPQWFLAYPLPRQSPREAGGKHRVVSRCYDALLIMLRSMIRSTRLANGCALECGVGFRQWTCRRTRPGQLCATNGSRGLIRSPRRRPQEGSAAIPD
jgi:hypothetical protein